MTSPSRTDRDYATWTPRNLEVELKQLYKDILWNVDDIGQDEKINLKTKILSCYKNYTKIKTPHEHRGNH